MELGGREILIALGALLIVAILLDGFRRVRRAGKGRLRVKRRKQPIFEEDGFEEFGSELPSGKARVVGFRDDDSAEQLSQTIKAKREFNESRLTAPFRQVEPVATGFDENVSLTNSPAEGSESYAEPVTALAPSDEQQHDGVEETQISLFSDGQNTTPDEEDSEPGDDSIAGRVARIVKKRGSTKISKEKPVKTRARKSKAAANKSSDGAKQVDIDDEVVVLHLMAEQGGVFQGDDLLKAVVNNGLRYGSLKIFHRHVREDGSGDVLFSMANSVNPGTFELNSMGEFSTPGVTFMMVMGDSEDPLGTFDLMLECIHGVNSAIGGELKDQQRSVLSQQTAEHYRQSIMDFNRRRLAAGV